jgi:transcriptional regulator with XRE-family HTH domain
MRNKNIMSHLKLNVKRARLRRLEQGLTLDDLFLRSGGRLHPPRISRIERGILRPSARERQLLAQALGVPEDELFDPEAKTAAAALK